MSIIIYILLFIAIFVVVQAIHAHITVKAELKILKEEIQAEIAKLKSLFFK